VDKLKGLFLLGCRTISDLLGYQGFESLALRHFDTRVSPK